MSLTIRRAEPEDFRGISALYASVLKRVVSKDELRWRFTENPLITDRLWNFVAEDDAHNIVAHSAFIPMRYEFDHTLFTGALSAGSMVDASAGGLFASVYQALESFVTEQNADFLFAFPNPNSFPFFIKLFGYTQRPFSLLSGKIPTESPANISFGQREQLRNALSADFLNWRLERNPLFTYRSLSDGNHQLYLKLYNESEYDLLSFSAKEPVPEIEPLIQLLRNQQIEETINLYCTDDTLKQVLTEIGFEEQKTPNRLVVKLLNSKLRRADFFLQMIDSDIF